MHSLSPKISSLSLATCGLACWKFTSDKRQSNFSKLDRVTFLQELANCAIWVNSKLFRWIVQIEHPTFSGNFSAFHRNKWHTCLLKRSNYLNVFLDKFSLIFLIFSLTTYMQLMENLRSDTAQQEAIGTNFLPSSCLRAQLLLALSTFMTKLSRGSRFWSSLKGRERRCTLSWKMLAN